MQLKSKFNVYVIQQKCSRLFVGIVRAFKSNPLYGDRKLGTVAIYRWHGVLVGHIHTSHTSTHIFGFIL